MDGVIGFAFIDDALGFAVSIAIIGGAVYGIHLIWKYFFSPIYHALLALSEFMDAQPTLMEIAHEFKPNDGETLRDQVDLLTLGMSNLESSVEKLVTCYGDWNGSERRSNGD